MYHLFYENADVCIQDNYMVILFLDYLDMSWYESCSLHKEQKGICSTFC